MDKSDNYNTLCTDPKREYASALLKSIQRFSWLLLPLILLFGWSSPALMVLASVCMVGPIVFSFGYGRAWCGNFCPRSSLSGSVLSLISPHRPIPRVLKSVLFRTSIFIFLMSLFVYNLYHAHGSLIGFGLAFIRMMVITTIMQICFAVFIHPYAWCSFCPMGSVAAVISKVRSKSISNIRISAKCLSCGECKKSCPMMIDIPSWRATGEINDKDCLKCRKCIERCSQKCLKYI